MNKSVAVGLDVGGTHIRIGAQRRDGELFAFEKSMRADVMDSRDPGGSLAAFIADYLRRNHLSEDAGAMLAGFPSTISRNRRTILQTPNIPAMDNVPMADLLERALLIPVFLERDVNLIYEHDRRQLGLAGEGIGIGIYFGTGIGNAIFIDGRPLAGRDGCAGEIGHIPMIGREDICGCGNSGCTECYASGTRLVAIHQEHFPDTPLSDIFIRHLDEPVIRELIDAMACVVAAEVNILNPEHIVLGGGLLAMSGFPRDFLEHRIVAHARKPFPAGSLRLHFARETQQSGVLGALSIVRSYMQNNKEAQK
ncbi:MAG: allose kinase [Clostridiaceae bacterium]|nr:allose kinase [Clostridiaceae bacterium]